MNTKPIIQFLEPYNFITLTPHTNLQQLLTIIRKKQNVSLLLIVKENGKLLGYLPTYIISKMVLQASESKKNFSSIIVESFFIPCPLPISGETSLQETLSLLKKSPSSFLLIENSSKIVVSSISTHSIFKELDI